MNPPVDVAQIDDAATRTYFVSDWIQFLVTVGVSVIGQCIGRKERLRFADFQDPVNILIQDTHHLVQLHHVVRKGSGAIQLTHRRTVTGCRTRSLPVEHTQLTDSNHPVLATGACVIRGVKQRQKLTRIAGGEISDRCFCSHPRPARQIQIYLDRRSLELEHIRSYKPNIICRRLHRDILGAVIFQSRLE